MKLRFLAALIAVGALALVALPGPGAALAAPGPQDHSFTLDLCAPGTGFNTACTNDYTAGAHADTVVNLTLGSAPATNPAQTAFFANAVTGISGLTLTSSPVGSNAGQIGFSIQTNQGGFGTTGGVATLETLPGGDQPGQPARCGSTGSQFISGIQFQLYSATLGSPSTDTAAYGPPGVLAGFTSTKTDPNPPRYYAGFGGVTFDQEADVGYGGAPHGVTQVPDFVPIINGLFAGLTPVSRSYGIASVVATVHTSVNFLVYTIPAVAPPTTTFEGARFLNVTVLGNPFASFDENSQTSVTCPPFTTKVNTFGTSIAHNWTQGATCPGYLGEVVSSCTGTTIVGGAATQQTVNASGAGLYRIFLSSAVNVDGDMTGGVNLFRSWNNCPVDNSAGVQTSTPKNGIGDACNGLAATPGGHGWANKDASAIANSTVSCVFAGVFYGNTKPFTPYATTAAVQTASVDAALTVGTHGGWVNCQDASDDGALNAVSNCPLSASTPLNTDPTDPAHALDSAVGQSDSKGDGIGDACRQVPAGYPSSAAASKAAYIGTEQSVGGAVPGAGKGGYLPGAYEPGYTTSGQFVRFDDICDAPFTIGGTKGATTCNTSSTAPDTATNPAKPIFFSAGSIVPDFWDTGTGNLCIQNFGSDANHDGYADALEGLPITAPACNEVAGQPPITGVPLTRSGLSGPVTQDPVAPCPNRNLYGTPTQAANAVIAQQDVEGSGFVTIGDLSDIASYFLDEFVVPTDLGTLFDTDADASHFVDINDLSTTAGYFLAAVPAC